MEVKRIFEHPFYLGECPVWDERLQQLYFVDILDRSLYIYDDQKNNLIKHDFKEYISCVALCDDKERIIVTLESGVYYYDLKNKKLNFIVQPEKKNNYRYNDGKVDPKGNLILGSMNNINNGSDATHLPDASLYLINGTSFNVLLDEVTISNGLAFKDSDFYYIDSIKNNIRKFHFENDILSNEIEIVRFSNQGSPDGMTLSKNGLLYVSIWGGAEISIVDLKIQEIVGSIKLPFPNPTSCTFGGKEMDELFITSAGLGDATVPCGLYSVKLRDRGSFEHKINWR